MSPVRLRARSARRRLRRSSRVSMALALLGIGTAVVAGALVAGRPVVLGVAALVGMALGWAAVRLVVADLQQARLQYAADRAHQAHAYRALYAERSVETQQLLGTLNERAEERQRALTDLEGRYADTARRAIEAETVAARTRRELTGARAELERLTEERRRANALLSDVPETPTRRDELAMLDEGDPIEGLLGWEEQQSRAAADASRPASPRRRRGA